MRLIRNSLIFLFLISPVYGEFKGNFDVSLSGQTGNSHTRDFGFNSNFQNKFDRWLLKGKFNHFSNYDTHKLESEKYLASEQLDWKYRDHPYLDYFFQQYVWDKDRSKNIKSRSSFGLGHGFDIYEISSRRNNKFALFLELGGNYSWENRRDHSYEEFGSARSNIILDWDLPGDRTLIKQEFEYLYDFGEDNGERINTISSIERKVKKNIGLKLGFYVNYDSTPIGNAKTTDTRTQLFLTMDF